MLNGRVVSVVDGDTVTVLDASNTQFKIRLMGINAPEKKMPYVGVFVVPEAGHMLPRSHVSDLLDR